MTLQIFLMTDNFSVLVSYTTKVCGWSRTKHQLSKVINMINTTKRAISSSYYRLHPIHGLGGEQLNKAGLPSFSLQFAFFLLQHNTLTEEFDSRYYHCHQNQGLEGERLNKECLPSRHPIQGLGGEQLQEECLPFFSLRFRFFLL